MASISTGQGENGRRAVDSEIPLVPFIDLLLCCIMFLLVTAVWNQLASVQATTPGDAPDRGGEMVQTRPLVVQLSADGYRVVGDAGDELRIPRAGDGYDVAGLREHLAARRRVAPSERAVVVSADDGVAYADVVLTMDTLVGEGFDELSVTGAL